MLALADALYNRMNEPSCEETQGDITTLLAADTPTTSPARASGVPFPDHAPDLSAVLQDNFLSHSVDNGVPSAPLPSVEGPSLVEREFGRGCLDEGRQDLPFARSAGTCLRAASATVS